MHEELMAQIDRLDIDRGALLDELALLSDDTLSTKPIDDRWSILEIVEHMVLAERQVLGGLSDSVESSEKSRSLRSRLIYPAVMFVLWRRIPVKVPSRRMLPKGESSLQELRREWDRNLEWLRAHVEAMRLGDHRRAYFSHPVVGPIDTAQAVKMARLHFDTHRSQIRSLQDSYAEPA